MSDALAKASRSEEGVYDLYSYLASLPTPVLNPVGLDSTPCDLTWACCFIRGDADRNGGVNIADVPAILGYLFSGGAPPLTLDAADVNDDGMVNQADPVYLLAYLFSGGAPPPPPFMEGSSYMPGTDPTCDTIELPCQDPGDFEHARNPLEEREIVVPPTETPLSLNALLPTSPSQPIDGTGGFGGIAPVLERFPGPAGLAWGVAPSYRTRFVSPGDHTCAAAPLETECGVGWFSGIPHVADRGPSAVQRYWIRWSASCVRAYEGAAEGPWYGQFVNQTTLVRVVEGSDEYLVLYDLSGKKYVFHGYGIQEAGAKGRLHKVVAPGEGEVVLAWEKGRGQLQTVDVKRGATICQHWTYAYGSDGQGVARLTQALLSRTGDEPDPGAKQYKVTFRYWQQGPNYADEIGGSAGDLMQIDVTTDLTPFSQPENDITRSYYYRYYGYNCPPEDPNHCYTGVGDGCGYPHQVRYVFGPDVCRHWPATGANAYYLDPDLGEWAERTYAYCCDARLWSLTIAADTCCGEGQGTYEYTWYLGYSQDRDDPEADHVVVAIAEPACPTVQPVGGVRRILAFNPYGQLTVTSTAVIPDGGGDVSLARRFPRRTSSRSRQTARGNIGFWTIPGQPAR